MLAGVAWAHTPLYAQGQDGTSVITNISLTRDLYNYQPVFRYHTQIRTAAGKQLKTTFRSDDFLLYPIPQNGYSYPKPVVPFPIKYLKNHPHIFVIITVKP